ncbi:MAG: magnesium transporter CorA family protein [Pleurocapsa minor GSE-CHR-MK-17-07R]|jgi:magnesium transporter|nr:magnesium transporter CorA family protein [Pleurocapsa minor GSE-CHR-MK 17-07R]
MLRSLAEKLVTPDASEEEAAAFQLRRNLPLDKLEAAIVGDELVWIDCTEPDDDELRWLERVLNLHPAVVNDLRRDDRRPALLVFPEYIFVSLFQARMNKAIVEGSEIHCLIGRTVFVTVRSTGANSIDAAYERAAQNGDYWRRGVNYFLYITLQFVVDSYYPFVDRISNQLNRMEEQAMTDGSKSLKQSVYRVKQQLIALRQMVSPQREVISNVIGEERLSRNAEDRELFRHLYERQLRVYDVIDAQRDLAGNVLDLVQSQENANLSLAVNRLTVLSMIFLPLTFLIGLFGLNFVTTQPEFTIPLRGEIVFLLLVIMAIASATLLIRYFRKKGWL